jgi:hypothetical protein
MKKVLGSNSRILLQVFLEIWGQVAAEMTWQKHCLLKLMCNGMNS